MIVMRHQLGPIGWEFIASKCNLSGGGRSFAASKDASEHIARHYLSLVRGHPVPHAEARARVRHVICRA